MQKHSTSKPGTPCFAPSKTIITSWLKSLFPDMPLSAKIQDFGDGVVYCRLLNHFYGNPSHSKISWSPKNQYQYANNLKHVQNALLQLGITIPFDVNRVAKRKFLQNWALINSFYKHLSSVQQLITQPPQQNIASNNGGTLPINNYNNHIQISQCPAIQPFAFLTGLQPDHNQTSIIINRSQIALNPYTQSDQMIPIKSNSSINNFSSLNQNKWQPSNLTTLAQNSLQMTNFLKQNINIYNNTPSKGKWSVGSQMFQNNYNAVVDRVKQILLKGSHDTQKIRQIKMLLGMPLDEEEVIKIEDDDGVGHVLYSEKVQKIQTKQACKLEKKEQKDKEPIQINEVLQKQSSNSKQHKISVIKSIKKPFKI